MTSFKWLESRMPSAPQLATGAALLIVSFISFSNHGPCPSIFTIVDLLHSFGSIQQILQSFAEYPRVVFKCRVLASLVQILVFRLHAPRGTEATRKIWSGREAWPFGDILHRQSCLERHLQLETMQTNRARSK